MSDNKYAEEAYDSIQHLLSEDAILFITATDIETKEVHRLLAPVFGYDQIIIFHKGKLTLYLGMLGLYKVVHVQCSMGSISRDSSIVTTKEALHIVSAKAVIMPGIAFGVDPDKQRIGDVLVAEAIQPYNNKRVSTGSETQRAVALLSDKTLLNRLKNLKSWEYLLPGSIKAKMSFSLILSGEELIDNKSHRDELLQKFPTALGGEMEGAGVYAACDGSAACILVKAICDFADGEKGKNKALNQQIAIESAMSACIDLLNSKTAFLELGIKPFSTGNGESMRISSASANDALFEIYDLSKEPYYIVRNYDQQFNQALQYTSVWIYGVSGCGKSSIIMRNLQKQQLNYIQVSLASCIGQPIDTFFKEILLEIASKIEGIHSQIQPNTFNDSVKLLFSLLERYYSNDDLVIFIEEIPLETLEEYQSFTQKFYSLLVTKGLSTTLSNIKFVLSSINDPTQYIQTYNQKVHMYMKFLQLEVWALLEIKNLISLISNKVNLVMSAEIQTELIDKSKKSPRFVKKFFRNALILNSFSEQSLRVALFETEREFKIL